MMGQILIFAFGASALLCLVGLCLERLALIRGWSLRWIWTSLIAVSMIYPLLAILTAPRGGHEPVAATTELHAPTSAMNPALSADPGVGDAPPSALEPVPVAPVDVASDTAILEAMERPLPGTDTGLFVRVSAQFWRWPMPSDRSLLVAWAAASIALWGYLLMGTLLLRRRARAWASTSLRNQQLLLSDCVGPALLGTIAPRIVIPRWFLDEPADRQALVLEHELQHLQARDPLLLHVALLAVAAVPWNLPLWWQLHRLRLSIELDCDARVLRTGAEAVAYGEVLLSVARRSSFAPVGVVAMAQKASSLELRIRRLVRTPAPRARLQAAASVTLATLLTAGALALEAPALPERTPAQSRSSPAAPPQAQAAAVGQAQIQTVEPTAPGATFAREEAAFVMPDPATANTMASHMTGGALQRALELYPEILTGRDNDGAYAVALVFNHDGSVHASEMTFAPRGRELLIDEEMRAALPPDATDARTTGFSSGMVLAGGGTLRNNVRLSTYQLPRDFDASRSFALVRKAVIENHGDLMHDRSQGPVSVLTVLMTDDGRIARQRVERIPREDLRVKLPREAEPGHFEALGVQPSSLGRIGIGIVTRRTGDTTPVPMERAGGALLPGGVQEMLLVLYAWPRRPGEPPVQQAAMAQGTERPSDVTGAEPFLPTTRRSSAAGSATMSVVSQSRRLEERALMALLETYPELLRDAGRDGSYTAALTLRPDGSVFRSGLRFSADNADANRHAQDLDPLLHQGGARSTVMLMKGELLPNGARLPQGLRYQYTVLPPGTDEARAEQLVREAVLARHADLLLPVSSGVTNLLTVMMTDDGQIARHAVTIGPREQIARTTGRSEDYDFEPLGISRDDIGVYGILMVSRMEISAGSIDPAMRTNGWRRLMVRYAWPRRAGEPAGGYPRAALDPAAPIGGLPMLAAQQEQASVLAARQFPEALADPSTQVGKRPWVLLSHEGTVLRTGWSTLGDDEPFVASVQIGSQMPAARFAEVEFHRVAGAGGRSLNVAFVWLAAGSGVQ